MSLMEAAAAALSREATGSPTVKYSKTVLLLEGFQWFDAESQAMVMSLTHRLRRVILPVLFCRPCKQLQASVWYSALTSTPIAVALSPTRHSKLHVDIPCSPVSPSSPPSSPSTGTPSQSPHSLSCHRTPRSSTPRHAKRPLLRTTSEPAGGLFSSRRSGRRRHRQPTPPSSRGSPPRFWSLDGQAKLKTLFLRLAELREDDLRELVKTVTGARSVQDSIVHHLASTCDGNAHYAEHMLRDALQRGTIVVTADHAAVPVTGDAKEGQPLFSTPPTLKTSIVKKLDHLSGEELMVLTVASVVGYHLSQAEVLAAFPKSVRLSGASGVRR